MIKKIYLFVIIIISQFAHSQIGVNNLTPRATLDIAGKPDDINSTDGIIIPTITKAELAKKNASTYNINHNGTLVFVNDVTNGTGTLPSSSQVSNINAIGFYYFNSSTLRWNPIEITHNNIYLNNSSLTGNRTVSQNSNTLAFNGSTTNAFSVDGATFSVNASNDNVGIGTISPTTNAILDVNANNKGFLLPRVNLIATDNADPLTEHVAGMEVYNTATNNTNNGKGVYPGKYTNDGTKWIREQTADDNRMVYSSNGNDLVSTINLIVPAITANNVEVNLTDVIDFELDKPSYVEFNGNISSAFRTASSQPLSDGRIKGAVVYWQFTTLPTDAISAGYATNKQYGRNTAQYYNFSSGGGEFAAGNFFIIPTGKYLLPAGKYSVRLKGTGIQETNSYQIIYGSGFDSASIFVTSAL